MSIASARESSPPALPAATLTMSGVRKTPSRLESVALKIAAATLPRAIPVIATDEEIVEGSAQR